ncbi:MAG: hypothetical protein VX672_08040 [Planctomycetota bacterium]|nr:hypothetical protein [Planctomycetota bacterium]
MTDVGNEMPAPGMPRGRRLLIQLVGFAIGVLLVGWCVKGAFEGGEEGWNRVRSANPWLIVAMIGTSIGSQLVTGALFWTTIRPVRREGFWVLQGVNFTSGLLNYAPVRIGMLSRIVYHLRVDRMKLLLIMAWFGTVSIAMLGVMAAAVGATIVNPELDLAWIALFILPLVLGIVFGPMLIHLRPVRALLDRFIPGSVPMLTHRGWLSAGIGLRIVDLALWTGRIALAAMILDLELGPGDLLIIAVAALVVAMNPLGRIGFREAAVSILAGYLATPADGEALDATFKQLALVESVTEAAALIPCGLVASVWWYRAIRRAPAGDGGPDGSA